MLGVVWIWTAVIAVAGSGVMGERRVLQEGYDMQGEGEKNYSQFLTPKSIAELNAYGKVFPHQSLDGDMDNARRLRVTAPENMAVIGDNDAEVELQWEVKGFGGVDASEYLFQINQAGKKEVKLPFEGDRTYRLSLSLQPEDSVLHLVRITLVNQVKNAVVLTAISRFQQPVPAPANAGCKVVPRTSGEQRLNSYVYRGQWLRVQGELEEAELCLLTSVQYAAGKQRFFQFPFVELWRFYSQTGDKLKAAGAMRALRRLFPGFYMPSTEWNVDAQDAPLDLDLGTLTPEEPTLVAVAPFVCEYSGAYFLSSGGLGNHGRGLPYSEHYNLLNYLSRSLPEGSMIYDLGTRHGASALALAANGKNLVISYDLNDDGLSRNVRHCGLTPETYFGGIPSNVEFRLGDVLEDDPEGLLAAQLIFLDTMHDGPFEQEVYRFLQKHKYRGLLICDDLYLFHAMELFWGSISEPKIDLTTSGHWSGTGLVDFGSETVRLLQPNV